MILFDCIFCFIQDNSPRKKLKQTGKKNIKHAKTHLIIVRRIRTPHRAEYFLTSREKNFLPLSGLTTKEKYVFNIFQTMSWIWNWDCFSMRLVKLHKYR